MSNNTSTALYPHPFSKAYWHDAANEMKSTKMLVITALMVALRIAMKPLAIPIFGDIKVQTAMLATALGAMIYGPVIAIPAAIVSDTIGFMIFPTGDYFLPFVLTEIASTMIYALLLYRTKVSTVRVLLSRFLICFLVNVVLQQVIYAWYYTATGNSEGAVKALMDITSVARVFKNLCFFPIESVVMTLFLRYLLPVTQRAKLTYCGDSNMKFGKAAIATLVVLMVIGSASSVGYLSYRYNGTSRSADFTDEQRVEENKAATQIVLDKTDDWDDQTVICIVDSAFRPLFGEETEYTVSVYVLDQEKFDAGVSDAAANGKEYGMDTLWGYSKSGPGKDKYGSMVKVATVKYIEVEKTGDIPEFNLTPVE